MSVVFADDSFLVAGRYGIWHYKCMYHKHYLVYGAYNCIIDQKLETFENSKFKGMIGLVPAKEYGLTVPIKKHSWRLMVGVPFQFSVIERPVLKLDGLTLIFLRWANQCGPKGCDVPCGRKGCLADGEIDKVQLDKIKKGYFLTFESENPSETQQQKVDFEVGEDGTKAITRVEEWVARSPFR